jgi:hypothetical protein
MIVVRMTLTKETPGTFVYNCSEPEAQITALYIKKGAFTGSTPPQRIELAVKSLDE